MFGFDDITDRTIEELKGRKIKLSFKGEGLIAELDLGVENGNIN